jgi:hypothetical protein
MQKSLFVVAALMFPLLTVSQNALAANACDDSTLHGTYVFAYAGFTGAGSSATRFASAGIAVFNGDGTAHGVATTTTEGQAPASLVSYTATYSVQPDCTAKETDTDKNGVVTHFDDFTGPLGNTISFISTDPNVVSSGSETRIPSER